MKKYIDIYKKKITTALNKTTKSLTKIKMKTEHYETKIKSITRNKFINKKKNVKSCDLLCLFLSLKKIK